MIKIIVLLLQTILGQITFRDIPYVYTSSTNNISDIIDFANSDTVRILVLGDSQETCPGGAGIYYIPYLNYELYLHTGNVPETPLSTVGSFSGDWLLRGAAANPGIFPSRLSSSQRAPNFGGMSTYSLGSSQNYGQLLMLQHDAADVNSQTNIRGLHNYFNPNNNVYLEVVGATNINSGEITVDVKPTNSNVTNYFRNITQTFTSNIGLQSSQYETKSFFAGPLNFNNQPYLQVEISGTSNSVPTDIIGARFISSNSVGYATTSFSMGGYTSWHVLQNHSNCQAIIGAVDPDIVWITYGANDAAAGNGLTPSQFKSNLLQLIMFTRNACNKPDLNIVLIPDSYATTMIGTKYTYWEQYVPICVEIANELDYITVINSCRFMYEHGLNESTYSNYLSDGVHYNPYGARIKAESEINILYTLENICNPDLNNDGNIDQDDVITLIDIIGGYNPNNIDGDLNNDGNLDQDDVLLLIDIISGGQCI